MSNKEKFLEELRRLMLKYDVVDLYYTIDDDGVHAGLCDGESWNLGWVKS